MAITHTARPCQVHCNSERSLVPLILHVFRSVKSLRPISDLFGCFCFCTGCNFSPLYTCSQLACHFVCVLALKVHRHSTFVRAFCPHLNTMSDCADNWASTPWKAPEPLEAVQHLRSLLCALNEEQGDQNVPQKVCSVVSGILDNIEEKIKTHCKYKHLIHVEHQLDATTGRDLVRIWKCVDVDHYTDFGYDPYSCPEGVYYDWQKIDVVNIWIKKTWRTTTSWQMLTKNETEQHLLLSQDTDPPLSRVTDIGTMMEEAIGSSASETHEVNSKAQEIMSTVRDTFPRNARDFDRTRSRSPRGEASQPSTQTTLQAPFVP